MNLSRKLKWQIVMQTRLGIKDTLDQIDMKLTALCGPPVLESQKYIKKGFVTMNMVSLDLLGQAQDLKLELIQTSKTFGKVILQIKDHVGKLEELGFAASNRDDTVVTPFVLELLPMAEFLLHSIIIYPMY
eukprot:Filipodium_phascolosomae@DN507_c0_g1_i2.p1